MDTTNIGWQLEAGLFASNYPGDYNLALQYDQRALDIREKAFGPEHPTTKKSRDKVEQVRKRIAEQQSDAPSAAPR